jgi:hypothetical protein
MRVAVLVSLGAVLAIAAACGSGTSSSNGSQTAEAGAGSSGSSSGGSSSGGSHDAGNDHTSPADAAPEAGDYGPYPAAHYPMPQFKNFGGPVLSAPRIVTVTFVGDANRDTERTFDDAIVQSDWWTAVTDGWNIAKGTGGVYAELPDTVSGKTLDDTNDLQPMIAQWIASGALPPSDANTVYVIFFPSSTSITLQGSASCNAFGGYHNDASLLLADGGVTLLPDGGGTDVAYAVIPKCGSGGANGFSTVTVSHELIEAATDPHPSDVLTWYGYQDAWWSAGGGEVGDVCEGRGSVTSGTYKVARAWVNKAAAESHDGCQPEAPGEVYFATAVPTEVVTGIKDPTGGPDYDSDGYMLVTRGQTKTVDAVVFSEGPLPNDVSLIVGSEPQGATDPTQLGPIATGVTASLSPTTGHNGTHVTLTIQVASTATPGDYPYLVRSILSANDYHSWWVVLRVQ